MNLDLLRELAVVVLLLLGTFVSLAGAVGMLRMPDAYRRAQSAAKAGTLGLLTIFAAVALHLGDMPSVSRSLVLIIFAFLSIPIGAHMIIRAAVAAGLPVDPDRSDQPPQIDED